MYCTLKLLIITAAILKSTYGHLSDCNSIWLWFLYDTFVVIYLVIQQFMPHKQKGCRWLLNYLQTHWNFCVCLSVLCKYFGFYGRKQFAFVKILKVEDTKKGSIVVNYPLLIQKQLFIMVVKKILWNTVCNLKFGI